MTSGWIDMGGFLEGIIIAFIAANVAIAAAYLAQCAWSRRMENGAGHVR